MVKVFIEAEAGSATKNRYDSTTFELKRSAQLPRPYPYPYGFVVDTQAEDGDCVDCYVITKDRLEVGSAVECEVIGLLKMDEGGEVDDKVLAALPGQEAELSQKVLEELQEFIYTIFAAYPDVTVRVGPILARQAALEHLRRQARPEA